jgi:hypothetical protein
LRDESHEQSEFSYVQMLSTSRGAWLERILDVRDRQEDQKTRLTRERPVALTDGRIPPYYRFHISVPARRAFAFDAAKGRGCESLADPPL